MLINILWFLLFVLLWPFLVYLTVKMATIAFYHGRRFYKREFEENCDGEIEEAKTAGFGTEEGRDA